MNQCGCDRCINFQLVLSSLTTNGVKCISARSTESVINTMCEVEGRPHDLLEYNLDYLFQLCRKCSNEEELFNEILKSASNKDLKRKYSWKHWENTTKMVNGKQCSAFERITTWGTFEDLVNQNMSNVLSMRQHLFHLEWQRLQFGDLVENLQLREVLLVIDFAKNYNHQATDEPQSAHLDRMQSTMHPAIAYYKYGCGKTVTDEMIHFTSDLKHDAYAVEEFERKMIDHLKLKNIMLKCIYEYSNNIHLGTSQEYPLGFSPSQLFQSCIIISVRNMGNQLQMV